MASDGAIDKPTKVAARLGHDLRGLHGEQRLVVAAAIGLFLTMFLPWYDKSFVPAGQKQFVHDSVSAWGAFSFVEAAVLLVAVGVLYLLFARAEGRGFHLPGGDGTVIMTAGLWVQVGLIWRLFDKPSLSGKVSGGTVGLKWGIFLAIVAAAALAYAGSRVRQAHRPEPPLPVPVEPPPEPPTAATRRMPTAPSGQLSLEDVPPGGEDPQSSKSA